MTAVLKASNQPRFRSLRFPIRDETIDVRRSWTTPAGQRTSRGPSHAKKTSGGTRGKERVTAVRQSRDEEIPATANGSDLTAELP